MERIIRLYSIPFLLIFVSSKSQGICNKWNDLIMPDKSKNKKNWEKYEIIKFSSRCIECEFQILFVEKSSN